jgi:hypothetical protein
MLYASSKDSLRRQLQGVAVEIQGTDASEVTAKKNLFFFFTAWLKILFLK